MRCGAIQVKAQKCGQIEFLKSCLSTCFVCPSPHCHWLIACTKYGERSAQTQAQNLGEMHIKFKKQHNEFLVGPNKLVEEESWLAKPQCSSITVAQSQVCLCWKSKHYSHELLQKDNNYKSLIHGKVIGNKTDRKTRTSWMHEFLFTLSAEGNEKLGQATLYHVRYQEFWGSRKKVTWHV